jgi:transposase
MIVLGADTHKRSHTIAAVSAATGELLGERTVQVGIKGFDALVVWARELGSERVWALEDCRHVSGSFERFLIERGERVLRVTTKLMADSRRRARGRGKSDSIDAIAVARAALREGLDALPAAQLEGPELDLRLLVDHRERLVRQRVALNNTLQWHLHHIWPRTATAGAKSAVRSGTVARLDGHRPAGCAYLYAGCPPRMWSSTSRNSLGGEKSMYSASSRNSGAWPGGQ